ncbi:hypothetical protein NLU66_16490 [Brachybacterium sp. NBEC-018]|uniref:hypothetical protein n=1 Tax=Brachybacterium sp. NBEC-018 TaxID=2996004 RepID=UPI0021756142|nr:hypothetical protein [Brachybacterium sp. NBEC-018]UVY83786.1 hypothetical protein NLU66_16490 [Brachybacterium sp. NBEC-018]
MALDQYREWSDEALRQHQQAISAELGRRASLALIPEQVRELAQAYRDGGGDAETLADALTARVEDDPTDTPDPIDETA